MKKINNSVIITTTILVLVLVVLIKAAYIVINDHRDKLNIVMNQKIKEAFIKCVKEDKCETKATLKHLEENKYISNAYDPVSKKIYNKDSYVEFIDDNYIFVVVE